jgi:hypothetical protein
MKFLNASAVCGALLFVSGVSAGADSRSGYATKGDLETVTFIRMKDGQEVLRYTVPAVEFYGGPTPTLPVPRGAKEATREDEARVTTPSPPPPPTDGQTQPNDTVTTTRERDVPGDGRYRRTTTYTYRCNTFQVCDWSRTANSITLIVDFGLPTSTP